MLSKDLILYLTKFCINKDIISILCMNKKYHQEENVKNIFEKKYPLLIKLKNKNWRQYWYNMIKYIDKLEIELDFPYIPTSNFNPEFFYKNKTDDVWNYGLYQAILSCDMKIIKHMIKKGGDNFEIGMVFASMTSDINIINFIIENGGKCINVALVNAARLGNLDIVKSMIKKGATDLNASLANAAKNGHIETVKYLIEEGATNLNDALENASEKGYIEIVKYLIKKGANNFDHAIENACISEHLEIIKLMIDKIDNIDHLIDIAVAFKNVDIIHYLKKHK